MKFTLILFALGCYSTISLAQSYDELFPKKTAITIGLLEGGGSLVGADIELLITKQLGLQVGAGFVGYGAGVNFHLRSGIRSSFFSLQYWHQGIEESYVQSMVGPAFIFRGKKWFTFQVGLGKTLEKGPGAPVDYKLPDIMLTYAIGIYLPF